MCVYIYIYIYTYHKTSYTCKLQISYMTEATKETSNALYKQSTGGRRKHCVSRPPTRRRPKQNNIYNTNTVTHLPTSILLLLLLIIMIK